VKPLLELRSIIDEETSKQIATKEVRRFRESIFTDQIFERSDVAGDQLEIDCDFLITAREDCIIAKGTSEDVKRFS
jgi:hypothetical protein